MASCCRGSRQAPPAKRHDSEFCTKCNENLHDLFLATATHLTRGRMGDSTLIVPVNCPKCNTVNQYKMTVKRQIGR